MRELIEDIIIFIGFIIITGITFIYLGTYKDTSSDVWIFIVAGITFIVIGLLEGIHSLIINICTFKE